MSSAEDHTAPTGDQEEPVVPTGFAAGTAVHEVEPDRYAATIADDWDIAGATNGGYLLATVCRALKHRTGRGPVSVTAHYLSPGKPGPIEISTSVIKQGRTFTTAAATCTAAGKPLLTVLGSFGPHQDDPQVLLRDAEPLVMPPHDSLERVRHQRGTVFPPAFMEQIDQRLLPEDSRFFAGQPSGQARMRSSFDLLNGERVDDLALLLAADSQPPTIFNAGLPVGWTPTLELTVHVRSEPAPGPLRLDYRTRFISHGRLESDGLVWDSADNLVAQSRQLALVPQNAG